jgi:drug/metabolite transporter (DMT)-like permease
VSQTSQRVSRWQTAVYTLLTLFAFAANSLLCRAALQRAAIDASTFSTIRLVAGAAMLLLVTGSRSRQAAVRDGSWMSAAVLFFYAVPFSFAYTQLNTGTGALIMFGCVQLTMMLAALWSGQKPHLLQWGGFCVALAGLVYLVLPGLTSPPLGGAALMAIAGVCWGVYSWRGRAIASPVTQTASNFVRAVPFTLAVSAIAFRQAHAEPKGVLLAVASGSLTSGLGYVAWYKALIGLSGFTAAIVQLAVPVLAAAGGVIVLGEPVSLRLILSALMVLGGIALALAARQRLASRTGIAVAADPRDLRLNRPGSESV